MPASPGIARGPLFKLRELSLSVEQRTAENPEEERTRLDRALGMAASEIRVLAERTRLAVGDEQAAILEAHALILQDPALLLQVHKGIEQEGLNAESAWLEAAEGFAAKLDALQDETLRARAADVRDVAQRVVRILMGSTESALAGLEQPAILLARDLTPSDTAALDRKLVLGFCTAEGGPTSHTAIFAKALGLPAVVGAGRQVLDLDPGQQAILDGDKGLLIAEPDEHTRTQYDQQAHAAADRAADDLAAAGDPAETTDGHRIEIGANVASLEDAKQAIELGAEGIGLLRTEFLYLDRESAPGEDQQIEIYRAILEVMGNRPTVVRTLDIGGDKQLPYMELRQEANPFLGWRGIRMSLGQPELFAAQLRALLRAGVGHDLRIMFPMVASLDEVRHARALLEGAQAELTGEGASYARAPQVGIMVEIPSVVIVAERFAQVVDFFSIGTNDLTQYTMAAERTNPRVANLNDACHPAVLRLIRQAVDAGHAADIWVGLCGELAGDPVAIPILLGLGLDELSMAPSSIPRAKAVIRQWSLSDAQALADSALRQDSAARVRQLVAASAST